MTCLSGGTHSAAWSAECVSFRVLGACSLHAWWWTGFPQDWDLWHWIGSSVDRTNVNVVSGEKDQTKEYELPLLLDLGLILPKNVHKQKRANVELLLIIDKMLCFLERCKCKPVRATQKTYFRNNYNYGKDNPVIDLRTARFQKGFVCMCRLIEQLMNKA